MKENELVTVVSLAGEMVGKLVSMSEDSLILENPRMIANNPNTKEFGFMKGIAISGTAYPKEVKINQWLYMCEVDSRFIDAYNKVIAPGEENE